jgi:DNA-binding MarR family transcriptional regulator
MTESVLSETDSTMRNRFSPNWWGKAAMQVALDPKVSDKDYRVFTVLAAHAEGNISTVGQRRLASLIGKTQSYISKRVRELRRSGWLATKAVARGQRTIYVLLSAAYGPAARASLKAPGESKAPGKSTSPEPSAQKAQVRSPQHCAQCHRPVKRLGKSGWCRSCIEDSNLNSRIQAARAELGQDATPEQLAAHLKNARLALRIRRILERSERAA